MSHGPPVLYLDFDGVLHHEDVWWSPVRGPYFGPKAPPYAKLFEHAGLLAEALEPYPDLGIVLSTSWASRYSFSKARGKLPASLRPRVVGATFHSSMDRRTFEGVSRALQILADARRSGSWRWLAIDDDTADWPASHRDRLVASDPVFGLSSATVLGNLQCKLLQMMEHRADEVPGCGCSVSDAVAGSMTLHG